MLRFTKSVLLRNVGRGARRMSIEKGHYTSENLHFIKMPAVMDAKEGVVDKWLKREGDSFLAGESLCEVSTSDFSLAIDLQSSGIITEIIAPNGKEVEADHPIASYVLDKEAYLSFVESKQDQIEDSERFAATREIQEEKNKKPDNMVLMREIKHLIQNGAIEEDFAKKLNSLARKGNAELLSIFVASFEGKAFNEDTFDVKFFLDNARDIVQEAEEAAAAAANK